jgi:hypothetical protein
MPALSYLFKSKQNLLYLRKECYIHKRVSNVGCIKEHVYVCMYVCMYVCAVVRACVCICVCVRACLLSRGYVFGPNHLDGILNTVERQKDAPKHWHKKRGKQTSIILIFSKITGNLGNIFVAFTLVQKENNRRIHGWDGKETEEWAKAKSKCTNDKKRNRQWE